MQRKEDVVRKEKGRFLCIVSGLVFNMIAYMILGWAPCWMEKLCKEMEKARKFVDELHSTIVPNWESKTVVPNNKQWKNHQKISGMYITGRPKRKTGAHGVHSSFCKLMKSLES